MQMARSTYYFELSKADQVAVRNHCLADEIKDIFSQHKGRYGVRRVYQELIKRGHKVNHKRVQRLMHTMGLAGKRPKEKYHSYKGEVGKVAENILDRDFSTTAPMQKWTTDVSQFGFSWGKCYLSPILDMNTNEIISYDLSQSANMEQIQRMLAGAFTKFPSVDGLIFHSDQGCSTSTCTSGRHLKITNHSIHVKEGQLLRQLHHGDLLWTDEKRDVLRA